jgi:shikimate kinase
MLQINPDYFYGRNSVMLTVFLCGFMGCGKTTIGKELATMLGVSYADMDEHIVKKKSGKSIPQIFTENGEEYFRRLETDAVRELP